MKKVIIWLLILVTYLIGVITYAILITKSEDLQTWLNWTLCIVSSFLLCYPSLKYWERYFKKMFDYYGRK